MLINDDVVEEDSKLTEEYVVQEARNGNNEPLGRWLMGCVRIRNYIRGKIPERDRDDVFQEVATGVVKNILRFRGDSSLFTFAYRVMKNKCIDYMRSPYGRIFELSPLPSTNVGMDSDAILDVLAVIEAISKLSSKRREIMLYIIHNTDGGYGSISMAAEHYGIPYEAARSRIRHAREDIHRMLDAGSDYNPTD